MIGGENDHYFASTKVYTEMFSYYHGDPVDKKELEKEASTKTIHTDYKCYISRP